MEMLISLFWACSWDYGTYHIGDQRRFRRACASAQSRQSLCCSHTWSMEVDEGSDQKHLASLDGCACAFEKWVYGGQKVPYPNLMSWLICVYLLKLTFSSLNFLSDSLHKTADDNPEANKIHVLSVNLNCVFFSFIFSVPAVLFHLAVICDKYQHVLVQFSYLHLHEQLYCNSKSTEDQQKITCTKSWKS